MKTNKLSTARSSILALTCLGVFLIAGFIQVTAGETAELQLQQEPLNLDVPVMTQSLSTSCGEAVIAMTYNYAFPATPVTEGEVIEYASANGYFIPDLSPYTSPASMVKIAEYYADDVSTGTVTNSRQAFLLLFRRLLDGEPVIIDVLSNFSDPESEAHFIVVTGLSVDTARNNAIVVHYNDPLTGTKASADWSSDNGVWNAWQTNNDPGGAGWWLVIAPP